MPCVSIKTVVKPAEAQVWAFMVIRRLWPDACGCDEDGDPWSGLQRAYTNRPFTVFENTQALALYLDGHEVSAFNVTWEDRLVVCSKPEWLAKLVQLPQWQHLAAVYEPKVMPVTPTVELSMESLVECAIDQSTLAFTAPTATNPPLELSHES